MFKIVFACDRTVREVKKLTNLCFTMQEKFQSKGEEGELKELAAQSQYFVKDFYGAGFLKIKKSVIFKLLGTAMTYFIVIVEFNTSTI